MVSNVIAVSIPVRSEAGRRCCTNAFGEIGPGQHAADDAIFHRERIGELRQFRAVGQLAQRDLARLRAFGADGGELRLRPFSRIGGERGEHVFQPISREQSVDHRRNCRDFGCGRHDRQLAQNRGNRIGRLADPPLRFIERTRRQVMRRQAGPQAIRPVEPRTRQHQILPGPPRQPRQIPTSTDIGEQSDSGFGHGKARVLGGDAIARGYRDADAAAHRYPVDERHERLGIGLDQRIEQVFIVEEFEPADALVGQHRVAQIGDVSASAKAPALCVVENYRLDRRIIAPLEQRLGHRVAHGRSQRVERLGPVERKSPDAALDSDQDFRIGHWRSKSRPTIIRMT
jgi:hypothetical protein